MTDHSGKVSPGRRRFLAGTSSLLAFGATPVYLNAAEPARVNERFNQVACHQGLVVYKPGVGSSEKFASVLADAGLQLVALGEDPVRQWRDSLQQQACAISQPVIGMTYWADYLMMRGLAAEHRMFPLMETRHTEQNTSADWSMQYAQMLLQAANQQGSFEAIQQVQADRQFALQDKQGKAIFSWVIG